MKVFLTTLFFCISALLVAQTEELMKQADKQFSKGQYEDCIDTYGLVIQGDPGNINALIQRGLALSIVERYSDAVSDYTAVLEERPELNNVRNSRGTAYMKLNGIERAMTDFNMVLESDPENQEAYNNRGYCKKAKGDDEGACEDWKKSKKLGNSDAKIILKEQGC